TPCLCTDPRAGYWQKQQFTNPRLTERLMMLRLQLLIPRGRSIMTATVAEPKATLQGSSVWPRYPSIYEINTWVWLSEMSHKYGRTVDQFSVPSAEWDA